MQISLEFNDMPKWKVRLATNFFFDTEKLSVHCRREERKLSSLFMLSSVCVVDIMNYSEATYIDEMRLIQWMMCQGMWHIKEHYVYRRSFSHSAFSSMNQKAKTIENQ